MIWRKSKMGLGFGLSEDAVKAFEVKVVEGCKWFGCSIVKESLQLGAFNND